MTGAKESAAEAATEYLTAARESRETVSRQRDALLAAPIADVLEDMPMVVMATNDKRQIVWMNRRATESVKIRDAIGLRPGEALGCVHSKEMPGGCGTSAFCAFCGTPAAIMKALAGASDTEECSIQVDEEHGADTLDLLVWTKPLELGEDRLVLLVAHDMSERKRHEVLERIFYHDIGNTIGGIRSMLALVEEGEGLGGYIALIKSASDQLIEEIDSQRALKAAEEGCLSSDTTRVSVTAVIERAIALFEYPLYGKDITISFERPAEGDAEILTDPVLLRRVVVNMLKNALEASGRGETIRVGFEADAKGVVIRAWNAATMSRETRMRVFQRSYSTKGRGRGLGTYGMRLLTERYLKGSVSFDSEPGLGTTFRVRIPRSPAAPG
ncbi:MAG: HAMP domain-containing histidine kinase [Spirochaetes bacterium]|nr:HAMP domain-containing histidine kinase [Spirochaetota bacterium]MBU1080062.1 HAMP domain-containing histidine kinase [Spirochaetota bacterium]